MAFSAAVIGTGIDPRDDDSESAGMAYHHGFGYEDHEDVSIVACADIIPENAEAFAEEFGIDAENVYEDYRAMLEAVKPDIVSVTVPIPAHADIVIGCVESGIPDAIHCEKPMALTWGGCCDMADAAADADIQLTFNHQWRFGDPYRHAKTLLDEGTIGELHRIEIGRGNLFDYGTHQFDLAGYFTDQARPAWILAGLDYRDENVAFGAHIENQATATWAYDNGVHGFLATGTGSESVGCHNRLVGTEGEIVIGPADREGSLYCRRDGAGWEAIEPPGDHEHGVSGWNDMREYNPRAIADVIDSLATGRQSELRAANALQSSSLIFGAYESVRRRGRVDDPMAMTIEDNPLESMVESGALQPE